MYVLVSGEHLTSESGITVLLTTEFNDDNDGARPIFSTTTELEIHSDDDNAEEKLNTLLSQGCKCDRNCMQRFTPDMIGQSHLDCSELDGYCNEHVNHQHLVLLGAMNALVHNQPHTIQKGHKQQPRSEVRTTFMFRGVVVCRKFFSVVFNCGEKKLKNVKKQFLVEGIVPKQHSNVAKPCAMRSVEYEKRKQACSFIKNFAENNALVMPGRMSNYKNPDLKLLPSLSLIHI